MQAAFCVDGGNITALALQAMQEEALDVEIRGHIDARNLDFLKKKSPDGQEYTCDTGYGFVDGFCGYIMYMTKTRSLRVRDQSSLCVQYWLQILNGAKSWQGTCSPGKCIQFSPAIPTLNPMFRASRLVCVCAGL